MTLLRSSDEEYGVFTYETANTKVKSSEKSKKWLNYGGFRGLRVKG